MTALLKSSAPSFMMIHPLLPGRNKEFANSTQTPSKSPKTSKFSAKRLQTALSLLEAFENIVGCTIRCLDFHHRERDAFAVYLSCGRMRQPEVPSILSRAILKLSSSSPQSVKRPSLSQSVGDVEAPSCYFSDTVGISVRIRKARVSSTLLSPAAEQIAWSARSRTLRDCPETRQVSLFLSGTPFASV